MTAAQPIAELAILAEGVTDEVVKGHLKRMSDPQIHTFFGSCHVNTTLGLRGMALAVGELDERQVDLGELEARYGTLIRHLRCIAHGQLNIEVYAKLFHRKRLLDTAMRMPLPVQRQIAADGPFAVAEVVDSEATNRMVKPSTMTDFQRRLVFGPDGPRDVEEQHAIIRSGQQHERKAPRGYRVLRHRGEVVIDEAPFVITVELCRKWERELTRRGR